MTRTEQARLIEELRPHQYRMTTGDRGLYGSLARRDKDDEDLDAASAADLMVLHQRYKPPKSRRELDELWNKITTGGAQKR